MSYDPNTFGADLPPEPVDSSEIRSRVQVPAVLLIVVGGLNLLLAAGPAIYGVGVSNVTPQELEQQMQRQQPDTLENMKKQGLTISEIRNYLLYGSFIWAVVDFLASLLVLLGGIRMLSLKSYGLAVIAAILAALPAISCSGCCGLGEIAGLWALIVLLSGDVRAAFR